MLHNAYALIKKTQCYPLRLEASDGLPYKMENTAPKAQCTIVRISHYLQGSEFRDVGYISVKYNH